MHVLCLFWCNVLSHRFLLQEQKKNNQIKKRIKERTEQEKGRMNGQKKTKEGGKERSKKGKQ